MEHTKEPWTWGMKYVAKPIEGSALDFQLIAMHPSGEMQPENGEWEANARRIVACVNACTNISTEHLERRNQSSWVEVTRRLKQQRDELFHLLGVDNLEGAAVEVAKLHAAVLQNNELAAALEQIATGHLAGEPNNHRDTVTVMRGIAKAALAKTKGQ